MVITAVANAISRNKISRVPVDKKFYSKILSYQMRRVFAKIKSAIPAGDHPDTVQENGEA